MGSRARVCRRAGADWAAVQYGVADRKWAPLMVCRWWRRCSPGWPAGLGGQKHHQRAPVARDGRRPPLGAGEKTISAGRAHPRAPSTGSTSPQPAPAAGRRARGCRRLLAQTLAPNGQHAISRAHSPWAPLGRAPQPYWRRARRQRDPIDLLVHWRRSRRRSVVFACPLATT